MRSAALPLPWPSPEFLPRRGAWLTAVASPFGVLSPDHFANSATTGLFSNVWHRYKMKVRAEAAAVLWPRLR